MYLISAQVMYNLELMNLGDQGECLVTTGCWFEPCLDNISSDKNLNVNVNRPNYEIKFKQKIVN
jgi:hypothetical protein